MKIFKANKNDFIEFLKKRRNAQILFADKIQNDLGIIRLEVIKNGDKALSHYTKKFDGVDLKPKNFEVTKSEKQKALNAISPAEKTIIERTIKRVYDYHSKQLLKTWMHYDEALVTGQLISPLEKVGIYVPGGKASYPSSVIMNAVPAKAAGVKEIFMTTPPTEKFNDYIIATAVMCGVDRIYKIGGPQAIFAFAYGTETIPQTDKIVGPGNIFVATAKKMVYGDVDIDMIAGPSEIAIVCDEYAEPDLVAMDMMSQSEHDEMAISTLITHSGDMIKKVSDSLKKLTIKELRKEIINSSLESNASMVLTKNMDESISFANSLSPEHLELYIENPFERLFQIKNAGAIFLGKNTPESIGDYIAGPSHVLPTGGTARFFSPLDAFSFLKRTSIIFSEEEFLKQNASDIAFFSRIEGLSAHGKSVSMRVERFEAIK